VPAIDDEVLELIAHGCIPGGSRDNLETANKIADWKRTPRSRRVLLTDAQTSGGLLLSVAPSRLNKVLALLKRHRTACAAINGTGIVIHTNVGRAPLAPEAVQALKEVGSAYSNLEYDLVTGERGRRGTYIENALALLCGAEAATVVNNCAAALVLIVQHFTR